MPLSNFSFRNLPLYHPIDPSKHELSLAKYLKSLQLVVFSNDGKRENIELSICVYVCMYLHMYICMYVFFGLMGLLYVYALVSR